MNECILELWRKRRARCQVNQAAYARSGEENDWNHLALSSGRSSGTVGCMNEVAAAAQATDSWLQPLVLPLCLGDHVIWRILGIFAWNLLMSDIRSIFLKLFDWTQSKVLAVQAMTIQYPGVGYARSIKADHEAENLFLDQRSIMSKLSNLDDNTTLYLPIILLHGSSVPRSSRKSPRRRAFEPSHA